MPDYKFRNDRPDDFLNTLREVGQWLVDSGQEMWQVHTLTLDNLLDTYTKDNCYVLYSLETDDMAVPAATFILQWEDPLYYPEVPPGTVGIIHKVAIRRAFAGLNLFQTVLDFCRARCLERGIHEIQLETDATRSALKRFYERNGFEPTYQQTIHEFGQTFVCQYYRLRF